MPERAWTVAVVDSGVGTPPEHGVTRVVRFVDEGSRVLRQAPIEDPIGHGTVVAAIVASSPRPVRLLIAQVLNERGVSTAAALAAAVDWAVQCRADLLHMSLGLAADRAVLRAAIGRAVEARTLIVAATPARGVATYPACYSGVIRATGDARCGREQISYLGTSAADFGARPVYRSRLGKMTRGASVGAAHLSRYILAHVAAGSAAPDAVEVLVRSAAFHGAERHQSAGHA